MTEPQSNSTSAIAEVLSRPDHRWEALSVGDTIESPGMTITDAHLVQWAGLTGDIVSLHLDDVYAAQTPFGQRVGHGPLTLSLALGLLTQTGYFSNVAAWLGLEAVRATRPVLIGDTIRARAELVSARTTSKPANGIWTFDYTVSNQHDEIVMTFQSSFLIKREGAQ